MSNYDQDVFGSWDGLTFLNNPRNWYLVAEIVSYFSIMPEICNFKGKKKTQKTISNAVNLKPPHL